MGSWYAGAVPPGAAECPVVVFVPGLGQPASSWWREDEFYGVNDMYRLAFADGYRTAFVGFAAPGMKPMDMWQNGRILAWQLKDICRYFKTPSVIVVAHSKGGVDAETAGAYYDAGTVIEKLITLSTPHWGSQLADLAYSSFGWHLGELLHVHSDGCYVMQTEYMAEYRRLTAKQPALQSLDTLAGCGGGPAFSKLWAGSLALERFGPNDCVVTVKSAQNPRGNHLMTLDYNHSQMRMGRFLWPYIRYAVEGVPVAVPAAARAEEASCPGCGQIIRGGSLKSGLKEEFYIDSSVAAMEVTVTLVGSASLTLTAPGGKAFNTFSARRAQDGSTVLQQRLEHPLPGKWLLQSRPGQGAYLAFMRLYGAAAAAFPTAEEAAPVGNLHARVRVLKTLPDRIEVVAEYDSDGKKELPALKSGMYSLETTLTGELKDGSPYHRTVQRSLLVRPDNAEGRDFLTAFYTSQKPRRV